MKRLVFAGMAMIWLAGAAPPDDFTRTVAALRAVLSTQDAANGAAARTLLALGAHPLEGAANAAGGANATQQPAYRERVLGPAYIDVTLQPGGKHVLEQSFLAGRRARVAAFATNPTRFRLGVEDGRQARSCGVRKGTANCDWVPTFTGRVRVNLMNAGKSPARFVIVMQ